MPNTQELWVVDEDTPALTPFSPSINPLCNLAGNTVIGFPTGEIILTLRQFPGDNQYHFYHWEPQTPLAWIDKGISGNLWDFGGPSYDNVWTSGGDYDSIYHFDGSVWTLDAAPVGSRKTRVHVVPPYGLNDVFICANDEIWWRSTTAPVGSGVWVDLSPQLLADTGIDIKAAGPYECDGGWGAANDDMYFIIGWHPNGNWDYCVHWDGANFSVASVWPTGFRSASVSESSADGTGPTSIWYMQADPSWGRFYFCYFDGTNMRRQAPGETPDGPEHNLSFGCQLRFHPITGVGYAGGHWHSPTRIVCWKQAAQGNGLWSHLVNQTIPLGSQRVGVGFWTEFIPTPTDSTRTASVFVVARDILKVNFTSAVAVRDSLLNPESYVISLLEGDVLPVVVEVLPIEDPTTTSVFLRLSPKAELGSTYQLTMPSAGATGEIFDEDIDDRVLYDPDGVPLATMSDQWTHHRTKVDSVLASMAGMYEKQVGGNLRMLLQAIMISDEEIGGDF
jgi:hypothetical protein